MSTAHDESVGAAIYPLRLILAAMTGGLLTLSAVALVLARPAVSPDTSRLLLIVLGAMGVADAAAYPVLRMALTAGLRQRMTAKPPPGPADLAVMPTLTRLTILGGAMAEGLGLFGAVVYLLTAAPLALAAPGVAVVLLMAQFPTRSSVASFAESITGRIG